MTRQIVDDIDRKLIRHLQADGRASYTSLAGQVGLSDAAVRQRVNHLTDTGVIDIVAVTDPVKLGLAFQALLGLTISGDARAIAKAVGDHDDAVYVVMTTGRYDLIAEMVSADGDGFVEVTSAVRAIEGVETVEVMTYLGITKQTYDWGVG